MPPRRRARVIALFVVLGLLMVAYVVFAFQRSAGRVVEQQQTVVTERALSQVADPLAALCAENPAIRARVGAACDTASTVASSPAESPAEALQGKPGSAGTPGMDGRGITSTLLRTDGHLVLTYSDGTTSDAGLVTGATGAAGASGQDGVGITSAAATGGHLVLSFSDGSSADVGRIVGDPGRGVASTAIVNGRLIVSYDDGTTEDAGELPAGPAGKDAELPSSYTRHFSDGTSETCTRDGGDNSAPVWACTDRG